MSLNNQNKETSGSINSYKDIINEISKIEEAKKKEDDKTVIILLALFIVSISIILLFPSFFDFLLEKVPSIKLLIGHAAVTASLLPLFIAVLYFLIKSHESGDQRLKLLKKIELGFENVQFLKRQVKEEDITKLTVDLLNQRVLNETKFPEIPIKE